MEVTLKPDINIIGESENLNSIIRDRFVESNLFNKVFIDTMNNEMENTDISICSSLSKYNKLLEYYGVKVLFTGANNTTLKKYDIDDNTLILSKGIYTLKDLANIVFDHYSKIKGK